MLKRLVLVCMDSLSHPFFYAFFNHHISRLVSFKRYQLCISLNHLSLVKKKGKRKKKVDNLVK